MKNSILKLCILYFYLLNISYSQNKWNLSKITTEYEGLPTIYEMKYVGNNKCIATAGRGVTGLNLLKSSDNGLNWIVFHDEYWDFKNFPLPAPNPATLATSSIINENTIFVAFADDATIKRYYIDPNKQDTFKISFKDDYFTSLKMKDENFGAITNNSDLFITKNGWRKYDSVNTGKLIFSLNILDNGLVSFLAIENNNSFYATFSVIDNRFNYYLMDYDCLSLKQFFINDQIGWVFSQRNSGNGDTRYHIIHKTTDGGKTWKKQLDTFNLNFFTIRNIKFKDENHGIAFAQSDLIYETFDGGEHWEASHFPSPNGNGGELNMTIEFTDDMILFGTINNGIWRRPMYKTGIQDYEQVYKTYPNPFVNSFTIQDSNIPNGCYILKLINQEGKEVYQENIEFNGNKTLNIDLPSGLYIWQLSGSQNFSGKVIKNN